MPERGMGAGGEGGEEKKGGKRALEKLGTQEEVWAEREEGPGRRRASEEGGPRRNACHLQGTK